MKESIPDISQWVMGKEFISFAFKNRVDLNVCCTVSMSNRFGLFLILTRMQQSLNFSGRDCRHVYRWTDRHAWFDSGSDAADEMKLLSGCCKYPCYWSQTKCENRRNIIDKYLQLTILLQYWSKTQCKRKRGYKDHLNTLMKKLLQSACKDI